MKFFKNLFKRTYSVFTYVEFDNRMNNPATLSMMFALEYDSTPTHKELTDDITQTIEDQAKANDLEYKTYDIKSMFLTEVKNAK